MAYSGGTHFVGDLRLRPLIRLCDIAFRSVPTFSPVSSGFTRFVSFHPVFVP